MRHADATKARQLAERAFPRHSPWFRYGTALAALAFALLVRVLLDRELENSHPFTVFDLAVVIAAWLGGFGPAMMNVVLGWFLAYWLFTPPRYQIGLQGVEDEVGMYLYLCVGIGLAVIGGMLHRMRWRLSEALKELARQNEVLEEKVQEQTELLKESFGQLRDAERMSMMGMLTAGLGHDLGNLLFVCQARLDAIGAMEQTPEVVEHVESIRQAMKYIRTLTSTLRQLSIDPERVRQAARTSPAVWVSEVKPLLKAALPRRVRLEFDVPALPEVKIDPASLSQIIFNLAHNAGDALGDSPQGVVRIAAHLDGAGDAVMFEVADNGPGMSDEVKQHCLEPSFTTKRQGHGTGMGLALVHHLVKQASGTLAIDTEQGRGTTFTIRLPCQHNLEAERSALPHETELS